jgi:putative DNA primase/helicase
MYADWFSFRPTFKLLMATNHKPKIKGTDDGIWRRIHSIPFTVRIADDQVDPELPAKLREEAPGILNWMVTGCLDWQKRGLQAPASVLDATKAYRLSQDVLGKFLDEAVDRSLSEARCSPRALYQGYQRWAEQTGERPVTERDFAEALEEKGVERRRSNGERYWRGIRLLPEFSSLAVAGGGAGRAFGVFPPADAPARR